MKSMEKRAPEYYAEKAEQYFYEGYNCSQAIACAFSEYLDIDEKIIKRMASPFGGGMGRLREVCGAVSGIFMILGALEGYDEPDDDRKKKLYEKVQMLAKEFEDENGSIICRELLGLDKKRDDPTPERRTQQYYESRPCPKKIYSAAKILAEYLLGKEDEA